MEPGDHPCQVVECVLDRRTFEHERRETPVSRHAAHHDEVLTGLAGRVQHVGDAEVHIGGQTAVQLDLALADSQPLLPGREVEETQIDVLLQLVGAIAHEEDEP